MNSHILVFLLCLMATGVVAQKTLSATSGVASYSITPSGEDSTTRVYASEKRVALVIGNEHYKVAPLKNASNDATDMAALLGTAGFDVERIIDGTKAELQSAVRRFAARIEQGGVGLFYYAGHGVQVDGENYVVPVDAILEEKGDVFASCVRVSAVLDFMEASRNRLNIMILDACRNNPFRAFSRSGETGIARVDAPTGSIVAYSTAPGRTASDGNGRNGIYTARLMKYMNVPGLSIEEVLKNVRREVMQDTGNKQVPWEHSALVGDFYFLLK